LRSKLIPLTSSKWSLEFPNAIPVSPPYRIVSSSTPGFVRKRLTILLAPDVIRVRYARTPSRPRLTSAFCQVTTTFGWR